jgi:enoyl-CoA hydratase/carnithine racemase
MDDESTESSAKITIERQGHILLIGINRPYIHNRIDPEAYHALAKAYYDYDHDRSLRAAVLFGHGENFSRGVDVDAFTELARSGKPTALVEGELDPLGKIKRLSKPLIVVAHGDTWTWGMNSCSPRMSGSLPQMSGSARMKTRMAAFRVVVRP